MGGHGGLNILPQKRWNVYNFDNREKVRKDEEEAAQREHIRRQEERRKDAEARLEKLRQVAKKQRYASSSSSSCFDTVQGEENVLEETKISSGDVLVQETERKKPSDDDATIREMKLFEGLVSFKRLRPGDKERVESTKFGGNGSDEEDEEEKRKKKRKLMFRGDKELERLFKRAEKEATRVGKDGITADDDHYKLGYGCLGRDKKQPWYLSRSSLNDETETDSGKHSDGRMESSSSDGNKRKKTIKELREERLKREEIERKRAQKLVSLPSNSQTAGGQFVGGRRPYYNSSYGNAR